MIFIFYIWINGLGVLVNVYLLVGVGNVVFLEWLYDLLEWLFDCCDFLFLELFVVL